MELGKIQGLLRKEILETETKTVPSPCCQGIIKLRAMLFKSNLYKEENEIIGSSLKKGTVMAQLQTVQVLRMKCRKRFLAGSQVAIQEGSLEIGKLSKGQISRDKYSWTIAEGTK